MPCGWEGNRRSGVALDHASQWFIYRGLLRKGDRHSAYTPPSCDDELSFSKKGDKVGRVRPLPFVATLVSKSTDLD